MAMEVAGAAPGKPQQAAQHSALLPGLSHKLVYSLRRGDFLFDPALVARMGRLCDRLGNVNFYTHAAEKARDSGGGSAHEDSERDPPTVSPRMATAMYADLQDLLELTCLVQENVLALRAKHDEALQHAAQEKMSAAPMSRPSRAGALTATLRLMRRKWGCCTRGASADMPKRIELPQALKVSNRAKLLGQWVELVLEVSDDLSDAAFVFFSLLPLIGTAGAWLFWVSLGAFLFVILVRGAVGLQVFFDDLLLDGGFLYKVGSFGATMFTAGGFQLLLAAVSDKQKLNQRVIGVSAGSSFKDPVATLARANLLEANITLVSTAVILFKDIPMLIVQVSFLQLEGDEVDTGFFIALVTTLIRLAWYMFESGAVIFQDAPTLQNLVRTRHLVFDARADEVHDSNDPRGPGADTRSQASSSSSSASSKASAVAEVEGASVKAMIARFVAEADACSATGRSPLSAFEHLEPGLVREGAFFSLSRKQRITRPKIAQRGSSLPCLVGKIDHATPLHAIRTVELTNCASVDTETLRRLAQRCPNLQRLELSFCKIGDEALASLADARCCRLESLNLDACVAVGDEGIAAVARCCGPSLRYLSGRNLPRISDMALVALGELCPNLEELFLDRDLLYDSDQCPGWDPQPIGERGVSAVLQGCHNLRRLTLKQDNDTLNAGTAKQLQLRWSALMGREAPPGRHPLLSSRVNLFLNELGMAGSQGFNDAVMQGVAARFPFLEILQLSGTAVSDKSLQLLPSLCPDLSEVAVHGVGLSLDTVEALWELPAMDVVAFDNSAVLVTQYARTLQEGLERLLEDEAVQPNACRDAIGGFALLESPPGTALLSAHGAAVKAAVDSLCAKSTAARLAAAPTLTMALLANQLIRLGDLVRRYRYRILPNNDAWGFTLTECAEWRENHAAADTEITETLASAVSDTVTRLVNVSDGSRISQALPAAPPSEGRPPQFPLESLTPFGVVGTHNVTVQVDPVVNEFELLVPTSACREALIPEATGQNKLRGKISPLYAATFSQDRESRRIASQYLAMPPRARYFCFAYPVAGVKHGQFAEERGFDQVTRRLLAYGGFLYFDADRTFVSASAFTVGSSLSFNGPFALGERVSLTLASSQRWQPVTIAELVPIACGEQRVCRMEFTWIFPGETFGSSSLKRHAMHGAFAYRVAVCGADEERGCDGTCADAVFLDDLAVHYSLASLSDVYHEL